MRNRLSRAGARLSVVLAAAGMAVRPGKCPVCGKRGSPVPQWSRPGNYHCRYCGSRFAYDDEPED